VLQCSGRVVVLMHSVRRRRLNGCCRDGESRKCVEVCGAKIVAANGHVLVERLTARCCYVFRQGGRHGGGG